MIFVKNPAELEPEIQIDLNNLNFLRAEEAVWLTCDMSYDTYIRLHKVIGLLRPAGTKSSMG